MSWWLPHNFESKRVYLEQRMEIVKSIRDFFDAQSFWEVETPVLQVMPGADVHIHGFKTQLLGVDLAPKADMFLQTSPEFDMKKLMVAGVEQLYQICKVFRNAEGTSLHSPEFTMVEWYRTGEDYVAMMNDCQMLLRYLAMRMGVEEISYKGYVCDPVADFERLSVVEAFARYADIDLVLYLDDRDGFAEVIAARGIRVAADDRWDDLFFRVMADCIEPHLGMGAPTILCDYPAAMACLSKRRGDDPRFAERFELYICGVELANAFSELTDTKEQRTRFEADMLEKQALYGEAYPLDEEFLAALEHGLPECSGIALGVDRLVMLLCGAEDIEQVLWTKKV